MSLRSELEALSPAELVEALSIRIYEPPLFTALDRRSEIAEALRVPILVLEFDTEVSMNGMLGFLENSAGLYFAETIEAFGKIGATATVSVLYSIKNTLDRHGVTPSSLRADFTATQEFQITTFRELHGDMGTMPQEVQEDAQRLYLYAGPNTSEPVWALLEEFVERNRDQILDEIDGVTGE